MRTLKSISFLQKMRSFAPQPPHEELQKVIEEESNKIKKRNAEATSFRDVVDCAVATQIILNSPKYRPLLMKNFSSLFVKEHWDLEPHLRYPFLVEQEIKSFHGIGGDDDGFMTLKYDAPGIPYDEEFYKRVECIQSSVHLGQRKLLIHEIFFLTKYGSLSENVVYIGAAGGQHIPALCELFPTHKFFLFDPAAFSPPIVAYSRKHPNNVFIYNELFPPANKTSDSWREIEKIGSNFLFISDIRRCARDVDCPTNDDVTQDMQLQHKMCVELQPRAAHLKCRLPFIIDKEQDIEFEIPEGVIYLQAWVGQNSTETRLVCTPPYTEVRKISAKWYASALFLHDMHTRYSRFYSSKSLKPMDILIGSLYDRCFDCTMERFVLMQYLTQNPTKSYECFASIFDLIKRTLGKEEKRLLKR